MVIVRHLASIVAPLILLLRHDSHQTTNCVVVILGNEQTFFILIHSTHTDTFVTHSSKFNRLVLIYCHIITEVIDALWLEVCK